MRVGGIHKHSRSIAPIREATHLRPKKTPPTLNFVYELLNIVI